MSIFCLISSVSVISESEHLFMFIANLYSSVICLFLSFAYFSDIRLAFSLFEYINYLYIKNNNLIGDIYRERCRKTEVCKNVWDVYVY